MFSHWNTHAILRWVQENLTLKIKKSQKDENNEGEMQQRVTNKKTIPQKEVANQKTITQKETVKKNLKKKRKEGKWKKIFSWLYIG